MEGVIGQVVRQCADKGVEVSVELAALVMHAVLMENSDSISADHELGRDLPKVIAMSVEKLVELNSPTVEALRMQVAFDTVILEEDDKAKAKEKALFETKKKLEQAIISHHQLNPSALEALFGNTVSYVIVSSGLGSSDSKATRREVANFIEKVFPTRGLPDFVTGNQRDKLMHIVELTEIVSGMRIYSWLSQQAELKAKASGTTPPILPDSSRSDAPFTDYMNSEQLMDTSIAFEGRLKQHLTLLEAQPRRYVTVIKTSNQNPKWTPKAGVARMLQELTVWWQRILFDRDLLEDVTPIKSRIADLAVLFRERVKDIKAAIEANSQPYQLYPLYMTLSRIYGQLKKEQDQLDVRRKVFAVIEKLPSNKYEVLLVDDEEAEAAMAYKRAQSPMRTDPVLENKEVGVVSPEDFDAVAAENPAALHSFAMKGFCPWTMVEKGGLLVPREKSIPVAIYKGRIYGFATLQAVADFVDQPELYVKGVVGLAKKRPELVFLLDLQDYFPTLAAYFRGRGDDAIVNVGPHRPAMAEAIAQTDSNPLAKAFSPEEQAEKEKERRTYHWNEWELRRRAVQLVNLRNKRTVSTQTEVSHFRRENTTQYWQLKSVGTMTGVSASTNTPVVKQYFVGIRGGVEVEPKTVSVTYDLTESERLPLGHKYQLAVRCSL